MKFQVDRESVDGLVLIDRGSMKELDDEPKWLSGGSAGRA